MKRGVLSLVAIGTAALLSAACSGEVVVQAQLEGEGGAAAPIGNLPVRAVPYDRDAIFDSLAAAYPQPEPQIPDSILTLQDSIAAASTEVSELENRWGSARDSLQKLSQAIGGMSRASPQYRLLFSDFSAQEDVEIQAKRQMDQAFARYQRLQNRFTTAANEIRLRREQWGDSAYAAVDTVITLRLDEVGREELADTTDANGTARFQLESGQWWITARYELPFEELYWNIPVEVARGEPTVIQLNRATAQVRPKL